MTTQSTPPDVFKEHDCCTGSLLGSNSSGTKLKIIPMFCHKWSCPRCRKQKTNVWRSIATRGKPERFITLTLRANEKLSPKLMCKNGKKAFTKLVQRIRRKYGIFEYMLVWELTKKGTPHIHLLQRGTWIPKQVLSDMWCSLTGSFIVDIKRIQRSRDVARYITKYMGKSIADCAETLNGFRILQKSKGYIIEPLPEIEPVPEDDLDNIHSWMFCSATPREVVRVSVEEFGCTLDPASSGTCLTLHVPPDADIVVKLAYYFDEERSYN